MTTAKRAVRADQHGSLTGYVRGCRCSPCRAAHADYMAEYQQPKVRDDQHGTMTGYKYGCRCISCREASSEYNAQYRLRRRPAAPEAHPPVVAVSHSRPRIELTEDGRYGAECSCGWWARAVSRAEVERELVRHARAIARSRT